MREKLGAFVINHNGYCLRTERMDDESSDSGTEVDPRPSSHINTITGTVICVCFTM